MTSGWGRAARRAASIGVGLLVLGLGTGCATKGPGGETRDPLQGVNRPIFGFNVFLDDWAVGPAARGYKKITHPRMRQSVTNFFYNLDFPKRFVASVGQAEGEKAATEVGRFVVNTTIGVAGFFDPATRFGMARYDEDIGQMFGRWGIPGGPYWVLPLLGPSNPRDTTGYIAQVFLNPFIVAFERTTVKQCVVPTACPFAGTSHYNSASRARRSRRTRGHGPSRTLRSQ